MTKEVMNAKLFITKFLNNRSGATLFELILSLAILGVLIGISLANFQSGGKNESARLAARLAESTLRQAQTMTLTGAVLAGAVPSGGYGVRFDTVMPTVLLLFADNNGNHVYNPGEEAALEPVALPKNASFSLGASLDVVFSPPEGAVFFNGASAPDTQTITFTVKDSSATKEVVIYRLSGQVRVQ